MAGAERRHIARRVPTDPSHSPLRPAAGLPGSGGTRIGRGLGCVSYCFGDGVGRGEMRARREVEEGCRRFLSRFLPGDVSPRATRSAIQRLSAASRARLDRSAWHSPSRGYRLAPGRAHGHAARAGRRGGGDVCGGPPSSPWRLCLARGASPQPRGQRHGLLPKDARRARRSERRIEGRGIAGKSGGERRARRIRFRREVVRRFWQRGGGVWRPAAVERPAQRARAA